MSKKIRELEEENSELKRNAVTRKPILNICINNEKKIYIPYFELDSNIIDCEYMLLKMDDVPNEAKTHITQEMLDEYNASLPSKEILEKYKEECRYYEQVKEHPFDIELEIDNDGDMKARDIRIEILFPEEIEVFYKEERDIPIPQGPSTKRNPIDKYYYEINNMNENNMPTFRFEHSILGSALEREYISQRNSPNKHFYNNNNSLSIRMSDLMMGYE